MADTVRELCIQEIVARLGVITIAGGYNTDIGAFVARASRQLVPDVSPAQIPGCNVFPHPETAAAKYGEHVCTMQVVIEAQASYETDNPSVVSEQMLGDLKKALLDPSWRNDLSPNYIDAVRYISGGADSYPDEENLVVGTKIMIAVQYTEAIGNPYP